MEARDSSLSRAAARERFGGWLQLAPALLLLGGLYLGALAGAIKVSLVPLTGGLGDADLSSWRELFSDPAFRDSLWFTVRIALISTVLAALAGVALALGLRRSGTLMRMIGALPVPVPHLLVAVIAIVWLAPGGFADRLLGGLPLDLVRDEGGLGIIGVYVYKEAPFIALLALTAMGESLTRREEAAAALGANRRRRLAWVVWPAIRVPVSIGSVIVAAFAIGAFEVPLAIGPNYPPTLAAFAFESTQGDVIGGEGPAAAALLLAGAISIALGALAVRLSERLGR